MPDPAPAAKTDPKSARHYTAVQTDLDKAKARLHELHPLVESEASFATFKADQNRKAHEAWAKQNPGRPYPEADEASGETSTQLQKEFHSLHYDVARLEEELRLATSNRAKA